MENIIYDSDRLEVPGTKEGLAKLLANFYTSKELANPRYNGKSSEYVNFDLYSKYMRFSKKKLYAIYFKLPKNSKSKSSKLEKKVQKLQFKLF